MSRRRFGPATFCPATFRAGDVLSGDFSAATLRRRRFGGDVFSWSGIALLKQLTENDSFAQSVCAHFPSGAIERGVPTEQGLIKRFDRVHKLARCTAQIGDEGGTLLRYVASWLQSLVTFELPGAYSADDRLDLNRYEPYELLARCRHFVQQKDLLNAVRVANLIRGESARIFSDWLNDAKAHLEVRLLVELLFAHAQATGIRTTY
ncbi:hypothetical protein niasHS_009987 [Heterodera schachtii]|uniref:MICOS complex subunit MIC60 n=1 Tax=Heterodera schachtii TaxID=97005 RepID=A0ABD2JD27_HETSC